MLSLIDVRRIKNLLKTIVINTKQVEVKKPPNWIYKSIKVTGAASFAPPTGVYWEIIGGHMYHTTGTRSVFPVTRDNPIKTLFFFTRESAEPSGYYDLELGNFQQPLIIPEGYLISLMSGGAGCYLALIYRDWTMYPQ